MSYGSYYDSNPNDLNGDYGTENNEIGLKDLVKVLEI
jgi:hypothetical protein